MKAAQPDIIQPQPSVTVQRINRIEEIEADISESDDPVGELLMWARDSSASVRGQAYRALADHWEDPRMVPFLLQVLVKDSSPEARALACIGLGRFLDTASNEGALESDYRPDVYSPLVLRDRKLARSVFERILSLASDPDEHKEVLRRAVEALGSYAYRAEVADLIEAMYNHGDVEIRVSALFAMGRSGLKKYRKRILRHLQDECTDLQFEAVQAAECWELKAALPFLRKIIFDAKNPNRGDTLLAYARFAPSADLRDVLERVADMLPDPVIEGVLVDVHEQILDDLELGLSADAVVGDEDGETEEQLVLLEAAMEALSSDAPDDSEEAYGSDSANEPQDPATPE